MSPGKQIILCLVLLAAVLAAFEFSNIDLWLQDHFYDSQARRWLVDRNEPVGRWVFYTGAKAAVAVIGVSCGLTFLLSLGRRFGRLGRYRRPCALVCLSTIFVPLLIAGSKQFTNVFTPAQIVRYGGDKPYVKVLERYPTGQRPAARGKGFPAGHATGGFALMMLYFAFTRPRWKRLGLGIGLAAGWSMGIYQTLDGMHYLSHTLVTMIASWIVILAIVLAAGAIERREKRGN